MAAAQETINASPADTALNMVSRMEALSADGKWDRVERLARRLNSAVLEVPERERRSLLLAVNRGFERVQTLALVARGELAEKLSELRRGRIATRAYGQPAGREPVSP